MMWTEQDIPDQSGRTAIVTGANTGLGFVAARALARKGARVVLACRNLEKGEVARAAIQGEAPRAAISVAQLDTADLSSVRAFADKTLNEHDRIDLLINNAGIMAVPYGRSKDGFELQFATNHLGHFALTGLLLPRMRDVPGSRVIAVSSIAARSGHIDFEDLMGERRYDSWKAYNQSKLANLMFALELQRRLQRAGAQTIALAAHPGGSLTNLFSTPGGTFVKRIVSPLTRFAFQSAEQGALPILYAATAPGASPAGYYGPQRFNEMKGPVGPARIPAHASDASVAERLWQSSEQLVGLRFP